MTKRQRIGFVIPLVWLFFWLALDSMVMDSPTMDEQNHIARGLTFLRTGDPRLSLEHPPLVNAISALPLLLLPDLHLPTDQPSWQEMSPPGAYWYFYADQFLWQYNRPDVTQIIFLARLPIVYMTLALALVGFYLARRLWGWRAAWLAFLLLLFDPNLLANGRYSTTDLGGTLFMLLAALALWQMWRQPGWSWRHWAVAAFCLGLAFASKLSVLAFVPLWALLALLPLYAIPGGKREKWTALRRLVQYGSAGLVSLLVVWAMFGFELRPFRFNSDILAGLNHFMGPMPTFWAGIEQILLLNQGGRTAFLLGKTTTTGFWDYFPVALVVKTPPLTLLMASVALVVLLRRQWRPVIFLLLPLVGYFALTLQSGLNIGYRHLLPMLPLLYVLISGLAVGGTGRMGTLLRWGPVVVLLG
ncbi:MAG: phospholipid carrier-dependent glycosyltransferase, partial [Anaerolineales bacterium]|nr:phospholipid carrier-dependent glycosyltransferase [Anaerolineales bacterium]